MADVLVGCNKGEHEDVARGLWVRAVKMVRFLEAAAGHLGRGGGVEIWRIDGKIKYELLSVLMYGTVWRRPGVLFFWHLVAKNHFGRHIRDNRRMNTYEILPEFVISYEK